MSGPGGFQTHCVWACPYRLRLGIKKLEDLLVSVRMAHGAVMYLKSCWSVMIMILENATYHSVSDHAHHQAQQISQQHSLNQTTTLLRPQ
eukprot:947894-Pelagomonas_calceolata.AAC.3